MKRLHPNQIVMAVCGYFGIKREILFSRHRTAKVAWARQLAMAFIRGQGWSFERVGKYFHRDHGTVIHAVRVVKDAIEVDDGARAQHSALLGILRDLKPEDAQEPLVSGDERQQFINEIAREVVRLLKKAA